ncbi:response regulator transcription factor [Lutispora saccharofermentans]|uniref:Stage 0 sporulation protein A homolog n=1 Tax=Lutispora saccharofermentans TaxID=3024236 RepID=A0ABT1NJB5_9FIRM|nr:response regulator [Lutispora saccharofermentans]MCQ1531372.1 response regulator [Lutispora saccharofermentans]
MKQPITILSIDDDKDILYALQAIFDFQGWRSVTACDVESGLKAFWQYNPDIILIDYHLPRINGIEGVRMLRQFSPHVPIIVFTIDENQEVADRFLEVGASDFALKPIKAPDLISRIHLHIRLMKQQANNLNQADMTQTQADNKTAEERVVKGISPATLELMKQSMAEASKFLTAEDIADATGLAYQTTYRYLQYMEAENLVEVHVTYGKVGRPKNSYRLAYTGVRKK